MFLHVVAHANGSLPDNPDHQKQVKKINKLNKYPIQIYLESLTLVYLISIN